VTTPKVALEPVEKVCPSPTKAEMLPAIARELDAAIKAGVPPNTLSTEWERLDEGARACRGAK
jgi:hypothetical protein